MNKMRSVKAFNSESGCEAANPAAGLCEANRGRTKKKKQPHSPQQESLQSFKEEECLKRSGTEIKVPFTSE